MKTEALERALDTLERYVTTYRPKHLRHVGYEVVAAARKELGQITARSTSEDADLSLCPGVHYVTWEAVGDPVYFNEIHAKVASDESCE